MSTSRRRFTREFKQEAVRLSQESGKSVRQIASELEIPRTTLDRWRAEYQKDARDAFRGNGHRTAEQQQIHDLQREVERLKREREILKKVLGIVSQP